ncbi:MAG: TIGR02281 family clan AA aspartic protease [Kordiimonas sp.]|nr:TIGR02281 family clan AA aspartic protease [Kordiimonas sp.]
MSQPLQILILGVIVAVGVGYWSKDFTADGGVKAETQKRAAHYHRLVDAVIIPQHRDGHYWIEADVNGETVVFMIDTGASHVALSHKDAQRIGLNPDHLDYNLLYRTANGNTHKAAVTLDDIDIGPISVSTIRASVAQPGRQAISLLGMNFLNRLSGFEFRDKELILHP